jgi:thiol-disulfide isomerase/thioredoxin
MSLTLAYHWWFVLSGVEPLGIPKKGTQAPGFSARDIGGKRFVLEEKLAEGPWLLLFWASWCAPCERELEAVGKLLQGMPRSKRPKVALIAYHESPWSGEGLSRPGSEVVSAYLADPDGEVARRYVVGGVPVSILVARDGTIRYRADGYSPSADRELASALRATLEE